MTDEKLYEVLGDINGKYVKEAWEYRKSNRKVWLKRSAAAACLCLAIAAGRGVLPNFPTASEISDTVTAPMITMNGRNYFAPDMPVSELPPEYRYLRNLTAEEVNSTGLENCALYVNPHDADMNIVYVYQECGTPVGENTVDNPERRWAYVKWTAAETD